MPAAFRLDLGEDGLGGRTGVNLLRLRLGAPLHLDLPVLEAALANHHPERDANQVRILELDSRPLVSVIDQDVEPGRREGRLDARAWSITAGPLPGIGTMIT